MTLNLYDEISRNDPHKTCLITGELYFTYAQLFQRIDEISNLFKDYNISAGNRIGVQIKSPEALLIAYYACFKCNLIPVPIPFTDRERISGAITAAKISHMVNGNWEIENVLPTKSEGNETEAMVIFTSGTTSDKLKGVCLTHKGISGTCRFMNEKMEVNSSLLECVYASIDHAFGFGRCHSVLSIGGTIVLVPPKTRLSIFLEVFKSENCNALSTPPSILSSLLRISNSELEKLSEKLRFIQTGAMRFDIAFRKMLISTLPKTRIFLHYGLSEAMRVTFYEINLHLNKLHTEGPPSDGVHLQILDEGNNPLPCMKEGRIAIKGRNLCSGYLDKELWESQLHNNWFITSDIGKLDEDSFLIFCGRADDTINNNGVLVHPDEIESKVKLLLKEYKFSILGIKDPKGIKDSIIALCFEGEIPISKKKLVASMQKTDKHLIPQLITKVEKLPLTRSGKVNRAKLRNLISN